MAALALTLGGAALGSSLLPSGISVLGATLSGASLGAAVGGIVGGMADQALLAPDAAPQVGPRLSDLHVQASTEGAAIARVFGRFRVGPTMIWAADIREERIRKTSGGKGAAGVETTEYRYFASFALGLCEGPIAGVGRVWADGKRVTLTRFDHRLHRGGENQEPDPRIEAEEGAQNTPAYRGLAYLVFEELPLEPWGNRIPQFTVEVIAKSSPLTAITMIPGAGEFAYDTRKIHKKGKFGSAGAENVHADPARADSLVALDQLAVEAPSMKNVAVVVTWHGDDLRCGHCTIRPKVEDGTKQTQGHTWRVSGVERADAEIVSLIDGVSGVERADAEIVSLIDGVPALGGTPSDGSVFRQIQALKDRGYAVTLYPFIMMDIPAGNSLPNPYGGTGQPNYPWRGRITCHPAPAEPGSADKTSAAASQIDDFFGSADPTDFSWDEATETVLYDGPNEWSFRRLVLHYATLAEAAGGVDAFLIGSELVGLTTVRSDADTYPAVAALKALAGRVRSIVGSGTKLGYAADWTEYGNHRAADGSNDVFFHLDPLWADDDIDFVGIDAYFPLSDWRPGTAHLDAQSGVGSPYASGYLAGNIEGGELFDWYYASDADRMAQDRTPITDGAYDEPWVHRIKDVRSWWSNVHHHRPGGVRNAGATGWIPQSKPIWFTEFGCPAVHLGPNQPNVFVDPKSSESFVPYFSNGKRDDAAQAVYNQAVQSYWLDPENNPDSGLYSGKMIDPDRLYAWTWDARPYPEFPKRQTVWADAENWRLGHWLTGRALPAAAEDMIFDIASKAGVEANVSGFRKVMKGYGIDRIMSARDALSPLLACLGMDGAESDGEICFVPRGGKAAETFGADDLVADDSSASTFKLTRGQESELPLAIKLSFVDPDRDYQQGTVESRRSTGSTLRVAETALPVALEQGEARDIAERMLLEAHVSRERAEIVLPPRALAYDPGDVIALDLNGRVVDYRIESIGFELGRPAKLVRTDADTYT